MLKFEKIRKTLTRNGFSVMYDKYNSTIIKVGIPLPKSKITIKNGRVFYGIIKINTEPFEIIESELWFTKLRGLPFGDELLKYVEKMHKGMEKIGYLIQNLTITKEDVVEELTKIGLDEELINFIKENCNE